MHVPSPFIPWEQCPLLLHGDATPPGQARNDNVKAISQLALTLMLPLHIRGDDLRGCRVLCQTGTSSDCCYVAAAQNSSLESWLQ